MEIVIPVPKKFLIKRPKRGVYSRPQSVPRADLAKSPVKKLKPIKRRDPLPGQLSFDFVD